jgi:hypothetical protein
LIQNSFECGIKWRADRNLPPAQRQIQAVSVQEQPAQSVLFRHQPIERGIAIFLIAGHWMPDMGGMNANLMGAAGRNAGFQ